MVGVLKVKRNCRLLLFGCHVSWSGRARCVTTDALLALATIVACHGVFRCVFCDLQACGASSIVTCTAPNCQLLDGAGRRGSYPTVDIKERQGNMRQRNWLITSPCLPRREVVRPWACPAARVVVAEELKAHCAHLFGRAGRAGWLPQVDGGKGCLF